MGTTMFSTEQLAAVIAAVTALLGGIFAGTATLLKLWWDKGAKAHVQIINAQAAAAAESNQRELETERENNRELIEQLAKLETHNKKCDEDRAQCREDLAKLQGYMNGRFEKIELAVNKLEHPAITTEAIVTQDPIHPQPPH